MEVNNSQIGELSNWSSDSDFEELHFSTCSEFLALNLTLDDSDVQQSGVSLDSCGRTILNMTIVQQHPARYAILVAYPIFLAICSIGNILTFLVLAREPKSVKRVYLIALAISDFLFMWSQFFPYLTNYDVLMNRGSFKPFVEAISGTCTFLQEMFITSSDWILVVFSTERLLAVAHPLFYNVHSSKKRAACFVVLVFLLAGLYSIYNLFDYYWFYYNDDPRCPVALIRPPDYQRRWHDLYEWSVLIVPVITFLVILSVNLVVCVLLAHQRDFRWQNSTYSANCHRPIDQQRPSSVSPTPGPVRDHQAVYMLLACALLYITTQAPVFVFNVLKLLQHAPFCRWTFTEDSLAKYTRAVGVTININYSVNFLLYYGVSTMFRQGLHQLRLSTKNPFKYQMSQSSVPDNGAKTLRPGWKQSISGFGKGTWSMNKSASDGRRPALELTSSNRTLLSQLTPGPESPN